MRGQMRGILAAETWIPLRSIQATGLDTRRTAAVHPGRGG
jgi:hypothetical protein